DGGDAGGRQAGEVAEAPPARQEDLRLGGQVGATGLDERDQREAVGEGDVEGPERLLEGVRVGGAALDGGVVGRDDALDAVDEADAGDDAGPDGELAAPGG